MDSKLGTHVEGTLGPEPRNPQQKGTGQANPDWIAAFYTLLEEQHAPPLFAKWAGVYAIGAAVQRKVWLSSRGQRVYPNFYIALVGPSGTGKGVTLAPLAHILAELPQQHIAPASITSAGLVDELKDADVSLISRTGKAYQYNALTIISRELGVFLPAYDLEMLSRLTDLYDGHGYAERRRGAGKRLEIPNAHLSLIGGTTPAYTLPEGSWGEGFMSRMVLAYSGQLERREIVEELAEENTTLYDALVDDLILIGEREGQINWDKEALAAFNKWYTGGMKPVPTHPKLLTYCERRHYNVWKLALVHCLSRGGRSISLDDFQCSLDLLLETEAVMPDTFKAMKQGGDQAAIQEAWHYLYHEHMRRNQQPIPASFLFRFLQEKVPAHSVERIVQVMVQAGIIRPREVLKIGTCYEPVRAQED
jgi:hypothetical protein